MASPNLGDDQELFFMNGDDLSYESFAMYRKHGYHPIILGDVLPKPGTCENDQFKAPRYRVIQKLGFGAFATVWLARDLLECRYVAVKVCCGIDKPVFSRETNILYYIQQPHKSHPGFDNVLNLHEAFIISGPNGFHECLVTEVVAPLYGLGIKQSWMKKDILRQIASALLLLHSQGISHGDVHEDNFGVAVPGLQEISEEDILDSLLGDQEVIPVIPRDPMFPRDTVPAYVTPSAQLGALLTEQGQYPKPISATIKLLDFGRVDQRDFRDFYQRLGNTLRVGGPPPKEWLEYLDLESLSRSTSCNLPEGGTIMSTDQLVSELSEEAAKGWEDRKQHRWDGRQEEFIDLIQRMVTTVPSARLSIAEVLARPWLRREV
ncbi:hypothetical protein Daus18300_012177 [Diaporthe australafricana]|uniref:non-specific serine/threonine protein kinase n=1 Tax=Diaporthe australafricana TaxID=127596 RepID=A0ABR3W3P3_9PEZI